jgi:hypothetical protein
LAIEATLSQITVVEAIFELEIISARIVSYTTIDSSTAREGTEI